MVKIDMAIIRDIDKDPVKQRLARVILGLCRDSGILVVGEGIETVAERDVLVDLGCDLLQGYLLSRPGPAFPVPQYGDV
jgi:EAL domain-containing protein (putative c-di-GMP-specific phosphodiesterase class I)